MRSSLPGILTVNDTSLAKSHAVDALATEVKNSDADIVAVSETWFNKNIPDSCVAIDGYNLIRKDRVNKKGGGVCFYVRNDIICKKCHFESCNLWIEIEWIQVIYADTVYYISCCYYPLKPRHTPDQFISQLRSNLDTIMANNDCCTVIVTGDFNKLNTFFLESEYGLTQCVRDVTHGNSILDKFFCSHSFLYSVTVYKTSLKTKHHAILATGLLTRSRTIVRKKFVVIDLRDSNIDRLHYYLNTCG